MKDLSSKELFKKLTEYREYLDTTDTIKVKDYRVAASVLFAVKLIVQEMLHSDTVVHECDARKAK